MIDASLIGLWIGEAVALHIAAWWNRRYNAAHGPNARRSIVIGSSLIFAGYFLWAIVLRWQGLTSVSLADAVIALAVAYHSAAVGALTAWLRFDIEDAHDAAVNHGK